MSTIEIILPLLPLLSAVELCTVMAAGAELLSKSTKGAKAAPRAKGAVPPQLQKNKEWVDFVHAVAQERGWPAFEAKDGATTVECEESVMTEEGPRFEDGSEISMKQAMSLAKHLKDTNSELWELFNADYEEANPKVEVAAVAAAPVRRTRQQISEEAAAKRVIKEAEMAERKRVREEKAAEKAAAKEIADAEKAAKKAEKEAAVASKAAGASSAKAAKLPAVAAAPVASRLAALLAKSKAAEAEQEIKVVNKWVAPAKGAHKALSLGGKKYVVNSNFGVYEAGEEKGEVGDWAGVYIVAENRIDDSAEEPEEE